MVVRRGAGRAASGSEDSSAEEDRVFHALADATRRDILRRTLHEEHSTSALARHYPMSVTAVQKHVAVLERAGLVSRRRRGRESLVSCRREGLLAARRLLDELADVWRGRVERIDELLDESHDPIEPLATPEPPGV